MSSFDDIKKQIAKELEERNAQQPVAVAGRVTPPVDAQGNPAPTKMVGTIVSKPGTEKVTLDASTFQFMECVSSATAHNKPRYCIVEKGVPAQYGNHFINSAGDRVHVVTKEVYTLMFGVVSNVSRQIRQLTTDNTTIKEQRDLYKLTIDALRKNGIID